MYTDYSNRYLGLDPNLGGSGSIPPPFMQGTGLPYANNFALPQIMAGSVYPASQSVSQPDSMMGNMMKMLSVMAVLKQMDNAEDSSSFQGYQALLSSLPLGNSGMADMFGLFSVMAQFDMLEDKSSSSPKRNNSRINSKSIKAKDLSPEFLDKVKKIADEINCDSKDLITVMYAESGLNSKAVNDKWYRGKNGKLLPPTYATGLIQITKKTARTLDTTVGALYKMTPEKQLDYVEKYLKKNKADYGLGNKELSGADLYALVYLPGRSKRNTLTTSGESYYDANKILDKNKDGRITKDDLARIMELKKKQVFSD